MALALSDAEAEAFGDLADAAFGGSPKHQVGGYPAPVQGDDMELECQLASNGIYCGRPEDYQDPRVNDLRPGAADWRLLLQMDSDDDIDVMWGDVGTIYFWVRAAEARAGIFTNAWLVLQCC